MTHPATGAIRGSFGINQDASVEEDRKEKAAMTTQPQRAAGPDQDQTVEKKIQQLRELFADAPEVGKTALQNALREGAISWMSEPRSRMESAGRVGSRQGTVSELTLIIPLREGGANRLRGLLQLREGNFDDTDRVGTVHDMRFVFLDNDTKLLFATAYDGEWDAYIDDFVTKIPDYLDIIDSAWEGWPGIRSPQAKDYLASHQVTAEGWYVANPDVTVAETRRLMKLGKAVDEFLEKVG